MAEIPGSIRPVLRRLRRRLGVGFFLDVWPRWATASLIAAGSVALVCRMFFPGAAPLLPWLWLAPLASAMPVLGFCWRRAYQPDEVAALADSLAGGQGLLLTLFETDDPVWARSPSVERVSEFAFPRFHLRRVLAGLCLATAFLAVALNVPQHLDTFATGGDLADRIAADLRSAVVELKEQELITPAEEQRLEEEVERIRQGAEKRVDAASWEAADALRERVVAGLSEKQAAVQWAQDSLARYAAAAHGGGEGTSSAEAGAELTQALEKLAESGMLAGAPDSLRGLLKDGKFSGDPAALQQLAAELAQYLGELNGRFAEASGLGQAFGRFDPSEFPTGATAVSGDGRPGRGAPSEGRADADLTWGEETQPFDRFKSHPLPPGAARSPDDWAPVVVLPGAPQEAPVTGAPAEARAYAAGIGQSAWRRSLAPRHQSAVKKYFANDTAGKNGG